MEVLDPLPQLSFEENEKDAFPEDWVNQLQLLDLQLLVPSQSPLSESFSPSDQMLLPLTPEEQHSSPGPYRNSLFQITAETPYEAPIPLPSASSVTLTREQLLSFSSEDYDQFVENISKTRPLTAPERRKVNKQKRLIKNRESAQQSRRRKKSLIDTLEGEVGELEKVNKTLTIQLKDLEADNVILKAEVAQMFTVIRDSPVLSKLLLDVASWMVMYSITQSKNKTPIIEILPVMKQLQQIEVSC